MRCTCVVTVGAKDTGYCAVNVQLDQKELTR